MGYYGHKWRDADEFIAGGRDKKYRPISGNKYLSRLENGDIALVLHHTAVVVYLRDGGAQLQTGGWDTITTKRCIGDNSMANISSVHGDWYIGHTGEITPPRVQKCRRCKGEGGRVYRRTCYGAPYWQQGTRCEGAKTAYAIPWNRAQYRASVEEPDNWDEHYDSAYTVHCEHGPAFERGHRTGMCEHGQRNSHEHGEITTDECWQCKGEGIFDYGSNPVPHYWHRNYGDAILIDDNGQILGAADVAIKAPSRNSGHPRLEDGTVYVAPPKPVYAPSPPVPNSGGDINSALEEAIPALRTSVRCPGVTNGVRCLKDGPITGVVMHLNDNHKWSRHDIADWLDTLDADLSFPIPTTALEEVS